MNYELSYIQNSLIVRKTKAIIWAIKCARIVGLGV